MQQMRRIQVSVAGSKVSVYENLLTLKANGDYEKHYNADMSLDTVTIDAENIADVITQGESVVDEIIHSLIEAYNSKYGTKFISVDSCNKFTRRPLYTHYSFCNDIVDYAIDIWEVARGIQDGLIEGIPPNPTEEEFIELLPSTAVIATAHGLVL